MKKENISLKIIAATFISILLATALYGFFVPIIMCYDREVTAVFLRKLISNIVAIAPVATYIVYLIFKPAEKLIKKINSGINFQPDELSRAIKSVEVIPSFLFIIGSISYILGVFLLFVPGWIKTGVVDMEQMILRLSIGAVWGILNGVITGRVLNFFLVDAKLKFKLYNLDEYNIKRQSILLKLMVPLSFLFIFLIVISLVIIYNYSHSIINLTSGKLEFTDIIVSQIKRLAGVYFLMLIFIISLIYIIIMESLTYIKNLSSQLNNLIKDEIDMSKKISIVNFDDIGIISDKINKVITRLSSTFVSIKSASDGVYNSNELTNHQIIESQTFAKDLNKLVLKIESELDLQLRQMDLMFKEFNNVILFSELAAKQNNEQISHIESTSNSIRNMIESFESLIKLTINLDQIFKGFLEIIDKNQVDLKKAINSIDEINETAQAVNDIAGIISDIASKTNLLSMNASIEAAHAGVHGQGFNVVAGEIRKLSNGTSNSAKNISTLINSMNEKIRSGQSLFNLLFKNYSSMIKESDSVRSIISNISGSSSVQLNSANQNLEKIHLLVKGTEEIKKNSSDQQLKFNDIKTSIIKLNDNANNMTNNEKQLTSGIKEIVEHLENVKEKFAETSGFIDNLKNTISKFKY